MKTGGHLWLAAALLGAAALGAAIEAGAFPYVVRRGETVGQIAERVYGRIELEQVIVAASGLEGRSGALVPGMRLEIPAVGFYRTQGGESWPELAERLLGWEKRAAVLARINGSDPWLPPAVGSEIVVPYNLHYVARQGDTTQSLAYRFLDHRDKAWIVASYNGLQRVELRQGEAILVPLTDLGLTEAGRRAARAAAELVQSQAAGQAREAQRRAELEIPLLAAEVRQGRYVEALGRGAGLLSPGLSQPQAAAVYRQLVEIYAALGAGSLAASACAEWRRADPASVLDPELLSPKIIRACLGAGAAGRAR
ncbi:MAG: LysM peptidoglycan-binding domain-containing protein [Deltaproteobacteria bacterium]|nr:LysM peptidoglycan-binding domain-containing protein [Deltaproteobacteria bacterium]